MTYSKLYACACIILLGYLLQRRQSHPINDDIDDDDDDDDNNDNNDDDNDNNDSDGGNADR